VAIGTGNFRKTNVFNLTGTVRRQKMLHDIHNLTQMCQDKQTQFMAEAEQERLAAQCTSTEQATLNPDQVSNETTTTHRFFSRLVNRLKFGSSKKPTLHS
jgi:glutamine synthetase adenylyltransferase